MNEKTDQNPWENFWTGAQRTGRTVDTGATDPMLQSFWEDVFTNSSNVRSGANILDIGCGDGAVASFALTSSAITIAPEQITCLDMSPAAIQHITARFPGISGVCADAANTAFADSSFDYITSQFGAEYASITVLDEIIRLLRQDGQFVLVMHLKGGPIHQECTQHTLAITSILNSGVFEALINLFRENLALRQGQGNRARFEQADQELSPCVKKVEAVLTAQGQQVAGGILFQLYKDIAHMYRKMNLFEPAEVMAWSKRAKNELSAYAGRMASMEAAALDTTTAAQYQDKLREMGARDLTLVTLAIADQPGAWVLRGRV